MDEASVSDQIRAPLYPQEQNLAVVSDGSLDFRSKPALRACTGHLKATPFIIGYELVERLAYFGIASNLILYMTNELHLGVASAAINVDIWAGTAAFLPIMGGFIADAYLGRYWTILCMSGFYIFGTILLTLSASIPELKPASCVDSTFCTEATPLQLVLFFVALYMVAIGTGGVKPCLEAFGADQFDEGNPSENKMKTSFFNWWYFAVVSGALLAFTLVVYVEDNASYGFGFGIIATLILIVCGIFLIGSPWYRYKLRDKGPLLGIFQVFVAAARKWHITVPQNDDLLFEVHDKNSECSKIMKSTHTNGLRFLDKAATIENLDKLLQQQATAEYGTILTYMPHTFEDMEKNRDPWRLCTVTQVEEAKMIVRIIPIWLTTIVYGASLTHSGTFFVEQAATVDRTIGSFSIPSASLSAFASVSILIFLPLYDCVFVPLMRWFTGQQKGITLLQRLGIGLFLSVIGMAISALVEIRRLKVATDYGLLDDPNATIPMSFVWLLPQLIVLGVSTVFGFVGEQEFFYDQVPDAIRSLGMSLYLCSTGLGNYWSSAMIAIVKTVTASFGESWIVDNINRCHLDYFYWLYAVLCLLNTGVFIIVSWCYTYKTIRGQAN